MKKVKQYKNWGIYQNNEKELLFYGFKYTVIHPDLKGVGGLTPADSDIECHCLTGCMSWIDGYERA